MSFSARNGLKKTATVYTLTTTRTQRRVLYCTVATSSCQERERAWHVASVQLFGVWRFRVALFRRSGAISAPESGDARLCLVPFDASVLDCSRGAYRAIRGICSYWARRGCGQLVPRTFPISSRRMGTFFALPLVDLIYRIYGSALILSPSTHVVLASAIHHLPL